LVHCRYITDSLRAGLANFVSERVYACSVVAVVVSLYCWYDSAVFRLSVYRQYVYKCLGYVTGWFWFETSHGYFKRREQLMMRALV